MGLAPATAKRLPKLYGVSLALRYHILRPFWLRVLSWVFGSPILPPYIPFRDTVGSVFFSMSGCNLFGFRIWGFGVQFFRGWAPGFGNLVCNLRRIPRFRVQGVELVEDQGVRFWV